MGHLYKMVTWYKNTLQEGKQCSGTLKRKDILNYVIYLFFLPNSTACHQQGALLFQVTVSCKGSLEYRKKKLTRVIFHQIFQSVIIMPSNLKKLIQWKSKQLQFLLKKVATLNRPHSKISITHRTKYALSTYWFLMLKCKEQKAFFCCCY